MIQGSPERYIAVDNVCAWPNLTQLEDGAIVATIFNQPTHGRVEGEVECWASADEGRFWKYRGTPAPHEPGTNRMNCAVGLNAGDEMIALVSGWRMPAPQEAEGYRHFGWRDLQTPWLCRSRDGGANWEIDKTAAPSLGDGWTPLIPYGDVVLGADGVLAATGYSAQIPPAGQDYYLSRGCFFLASRDGGRSWEKPVPITPHSGYSEGALLHLGAGRWIAAVRSENGGHLEQYCSDDNGANWCFDQVLTLPRQHPAHLLRLNDGRLLLTYGVRCVGHFGIDARLSANDGEKWHAPFTVTSFESSAEDRPGFPAYDGGYPASVQNADGSIVTAYYARSQPFHHRYHMGVVRWYLAG